MPEHADTDWLYVGTSGTTCYIDGERGTVTEVVRELGLRRAPRAAFVYLDDEEVMLHVTLGQARGDRDQWREVERARRITRDEFDRLTDLDTLRRDLGWREPLTRPANRGGACPQGECLDAGSAGCYFGPATCATPKRAATRETVGMVCQTCQTDYSKPSRPAEIEYVDCTCGHPYADHSVGVCDFKGCGCGMSEPLNRPGQPTGGDPS